MTNPYDTPENIQVAAAFLGGFQHEWQQGARVMKLLESEATRQFAANFAQAFSRWYEKKTMEEHDAQRFLSCMAVGTTAALRTALAQQSQGL